MPDIKLTEQEVQTLLRCLNDRVEPPEELAKKLFPVRKKTIRDFGAMRDPVLGTLAWHSFAFLAPWREKFSNLMRESREG